MLSGVLIILLFFAVFLVFGEKNVSYLKNLLSMFNMLFWVIILWVSYNLGINMFKKEKADHAMEYLFSAPLTKFEIIIKKIIPRLFVLIILLFIYYLIHKIHILLNIQNSIFISFFKIGVFTIWMFFCAAFLSIYEWGDFKALVWLIITFPGYNLNLILDYFFKKNVVEGSTIILSIDIIYISQIILLIILGVGFIFVFKYSDIRPQKMLKNKFALISTIPLTAIVLTSFYFGIIK